MPQVTIRTGVIDADGREEVLTEYLCDAPGCPNVATEVIGHVKELRLSFATCREHVGRIGSASASVDGEGWTGPSQ